MVVCGPTPPSAGHYEMGPLVCHRMLCCQVQSIWHHSHTCLLLMWPFHSAKTSCGLSQDTCRLRVFNYRLSRARLNVKNTCGILTSQCHMYRGVIEISPANMDACVKATCVLHNFLRRSTNITRMPIPSSGDGEAAGLHEVTQVGSNNATREAIRVREKCMTYFSTEGAVP